jgi:hypothetical protein
VDDAQPTFFLANKGSQYEDAKQYRYRANGVLAQAGTPPIVSKVAIATALV